MPPWSVQDAKARFSEMLDICLNEGPQVISRRGVDAAVLVPIDQWRRLQGDAPTLKDCCCPTTRAGHPGAATRQPQAPGTHGFRLNVYLIDTNVVSELRKPARIRACSRGCGTCRPRSVPRVRDRG